MLESTPELLTLLQQEVGDTAPNATTQARYLALIDKAHKEIVAGGGELNLDSRGKPVRDPFIFPWAVAKRPKILTLLPEVDGTADVTQLSASVVNSSVNASTTDLTGWHVRFSSDQTVYYIQAHSGTTITLDSAYVDASSTSQQMTAFKLVYPVGSNDIRFPSDRLRTYTELNEDISMCDLGELLEQWPLTRVYARMPLLCAITNQDGVGNLTLQFSHYPSTPQRVEMFFVPRPADLTLSGSDPILPNYRTVLVHLAAFYHLRKRDDTRAQSHFATARGLFDALTTEARQVMNSNDENFGAVSPFPGGFGQSSFRYFTRA